MRAWGILFVLSFGAIVAWKISESPALFMAMLVWFGTLVTMVMTGFTLAMVMRYSRSRESTPRPPAPQGYIIDQPGPYQALPTPQRSPMDSGRTELLPAHFTDPLAPRQ